MLIKGAFVGEKNFDVIKMHGTTIKTTINNSLEDSSFSEDISNSGKRGSEFFFFLLNSQYYATAYEPDVSST